MDWQVLLNLAARQKCLHAFSMWTKKHRILTPYDAQLQSGVYVLLARHARLNHLAVEVLEILSQQGIRATLIKGASIAGLYPDPDMRDFGVNKQITLKTQKSANGQGFPTYNYLVSL